MAKISEAELQPVLEAFSVPVDRFLFNKYKKLYNQGYFQLDDFKKGNKNTNGYAFCCEWFKLCPEGSEPFYKQTWFFITCGGVALLFILGIAVGVFICLRRRKEKSGGGGGKGKK
ncbi:hypothetical protein GCK72_007772 [Caenorhabditis remanei]|uniref:Uncharacterized protein n=1 Tax=Caenorhabditis remanei TaxID=31234 RepID=A0A6A5HN75_CAERE|nr:hypothetical protein GCK72_007772 [Caenorhabditis remanei]KAF1767813.1 hypothetical protein GCK72_007772 [Caenorhabditis remanei]